MKLKDFKNRKKILVEATEQVKIDKTRKYRRGDNYVPDDFMEMEKSSDADYFFGFESEYSKPARELFEEASAAKDIEETLESKYFRPDF